MTFYVESKDDLEIIRNVNEIVFRGNYICFYGKNITYECKSEGTEHAEIDPGDGFYLMKKRIIKVYSL